MLGRFGYTELNRVWKRYLVVRSFTKKQERVGALLGIHLVVHLCELYWRITNSCVFITRVKMENRVSVDWWREKQMNRREEYCKALPNPVEEQMQEA